MTIPTSTVPTAKAWLFGQLGTALTAASDATFGLTYATATDSPGNPDDMVWLGDVVNRQVTAFAMVGNMGAGSLRENYDLTVMVNCYRGGDQAQEVETRALALSDTVETVVRTDPTFGGAVLKAQPDQSSVSVTWDEEFKGRLAAIQLTISCLAVI